MAIIGKSGSGKSTLLNIIGLLDDYSSGSYYLNDKSVSTFREKELASLRMNNFGYVFQEYYLELEFTVYQNLRIPFIIKKMKKKEYDEIINDVLLKFDLLNKSKIKAKKLSGGEKQRLSIARALLNNPSIILADEPTGALDSANSKIVLETLKNINMQGKTVILVTHNLEEAKYAKRIITLKDGEIISDEKNTC